MQSPLVKVVLTRIAWSSAAEKRKATKSGKAYDHLLFYEMKIEVNISLKPEVLIGKEISWEK